VGPADRRRHRSGRRPGPAAPARAGRADGRGLPDGRDLHRSRRPAPDLRSLLVSVAPRAAACARRRRGPGAHTPVLDRLVRAVQVHGSVARRRASIAHHAQGPDLCADGRARGRADDVVARAPRRREKLGLSLLLAARRHVHADGAPRGRLPGRSARLARVAAARGCRRALAAPHHVRHRRRAAPPRAGAPLAAGVRGRGARPHGQRRTHARSSSSSSRRGRSRTTASGRCAARAGTSRTRR